MIARVSIKTFSEGNAEANEQKQKSHFTMALVLNSFVTVSTKYNIRLTLQYVAH